MAKIPVKTITVQYNPTATQWVDSFDSSPQVAFGSDTPMGAVRSLLTGSESIPGPYRLQLDQDQVGSGVLIRVATWKPPELLVQCTACDGRGEYVGLVVKEVCKVCGGRKVVAG
jgi:hypothetical protein